MSNRWGAAHLTLGCIAAATVTALARGPASPPAQPASGPGGADYRYTQIAATAYRSAGQPYWLFAPESFGSEALPVIVFLHAQGQTQRDYQAWIEHLVKRGNLVVFPRFEDQATGDDMTRSVARAVIDALARLDGQRHPRADPSKLALIGHGLGALVAANVAATPDRGMPSVRALMIIAPVDVTGSNITGASIVAPVALGDYSSIAPDVLTLVVVGADDRVAGQALARKMFDDLAQIRDADKGYVVVNSDRTGTPALVADHAAPLAPLAAARASHTATVPGRTDALDYYGYWKLLDRLTDAAFTGERSDHALGGTVSSQ